MITRDQAIIGSDDDRKSYNRNLIIPHAKLEAALSSIEDQVTTESGYPITILVGPTGAGKSSLGRYWVRKVIENFAKKIQEDPSFIPVAMVEVDAPGKNHEIDFSLLFSRITHGLLSPSALDGFTILRRGKRALRYRKSESTNDGTSHKRARSSLPCS